MKSPRRLLTIAHSYHVPLNRRLAYALQREGAGRWEVTAAAPRSLRGDFLAGEPLETFAEEPCKVLPVEAFLSRWPHLMLYGNTLRRALRQPWDLVHCWQEPYVFSGAQTALWTPPGVPLVYATFQNIDKRYPPPFSWFERYSLDRCAGWIGHGETVVATMLKRGYGKKPGRFIPPGVDLEAFAPDLGRRREVRRKLGWEEDGPPVVGYLGRFVAEKGLRLLTRTLERTRTPWRALFVGGGPLERELHLWAGAQGGKARVLTGVSHDCVPDYLNALDVLCAPSQTTSHWREQFGRMLIEAFACGVAVAASDSGEIPNVVKDAALVLGENDEAAWVAGLSDLLESPAKRAALAAKGRDLARREYAWPLIARRHLDFFEELIEKRTRSRPAGPRRLLSISPSYVVALNRGLPNEMQRLGGAQWEVTAAAPDYLKVGDARLITAPGAGEPARLEIVRAYLSAPSPFLFYGPRLRELLREPWDIVHFWTEPYSLAAAQIAWWAPRSSKLVFRSAQNIFKRYPFPFSFFETRSVERCAGWTASGATVVENLLRRGYGRRPHRLIPLGFDPAVFKPGIPAAKEPGPPVVGFVGRLVPEKGLRLLTSVLDKIRIPWRAMIIGDGPLETEARRWAQAQAGRARVLTGVAHAEVPAHMNALDILCVPSQTTPRWREQFGRVIVEGLACGVPVIASDSGEIPNVLQGEGIVVGENDEAGWTAALSELLASPAKRADLSRRGLALALREYTWRAAAEKHLEFFSELLAS